MSSVLKGTGLSAQKSKFSVLSIDSLSDNSEDESDWKQVKGNSVKNKNKPAKGPVSSGDNKPLSKNAKKRARKRKQRELSESSDGKCAESAAAVGDESGLSWEDEVRMRNQAAVDSEFQKDLERALLLSKADAQDHAKMMEDSLLAERIAINESLSTAPKSSGKKKNMTLSLQEFHRGEPAEGPKKPKQPDVFADDPVTPTTPTDDFFQRLSESVHQEVAKEERKTKSRTQSNDSGEDPGDLPRIAQLQDDLEKRDAQIDKLQRHNDQLKKALKEVKQRNQSLCKILSQGEFASKTELIQQVDELTTVKNDLTEEVKTLHSSLEQERSKNKSLKLELAKYNGGQTKSTKNSASS